MPGLPPYIVLDMVADVKKALRLVWLGISLAVLAVVAAPFALPHSWISRLAPVCERKASTGRECPACGLTTAFLAISHGDLGAASRSHRAAVPLFGLLLVNEAVFALSVARRGKGS
ncbi:MAG: DUF2752 domain-containing protein [Bryobacteraceae bacterium]|nr:DUF2752 domain-containing protein [Bryobacteraceae bacterium]